MNEFTDGANINTLLLGLLDLGVIFALGQFRAVKEAVRTIQADVLDLRTEFNRHIANNNGNTTRETHSTIERSTTQ